jgi:hypothetical protein
MAAPMPTKIIQMALISCYTGQQHNRNLETNSGYFHIKHQPIKISEDVLVPIYGYKFSEPHALGLVCLVLQTRPSSQDSW